MTAPADLSRVRNNRAATTSPERRAVGRNRILFAVAVIVIAVGLSIARARNVPTVQVVTASTTADGGVSVGSTSVTANGYVVARTKASVSAKIAGRLAYLGVSERSNVRQGDVIARLDNADYQAAISQAQANIASAEANTIKARAERDQP